MRQNPYHCSRPYWHGLDTLPQSDGTTTQYFAYDGLGSVRQLVDASKSVGLAQTLMHSETLCVES